MKKIIFVLLTGIVVFGCKKIDGIDHSTLTTENLFKTSTDLENLLYGSYSAVASDKALPGLWKVFPELMADHVDVNFIENIPTDPYPQLFNRNMVQAQYAQTWALAYTAIQNANLIIQAIDNKTIRRENDPSFVDAKRDGIKGEAHLIRGLTYFELIRFYGHQYGYLSGEANSGVILRTKPVLNVTSPDQVIGQGRATVEEVYKLIISDLKTAELLIPPYGERRGRASNYAASAILARVYFQMGDYPTALAQINSVIGETPGVLTRFALSRTPAVGPVTAANAITNAQAPFITTGATGTSAVENIFDLVSATNTPVNGVINRKYARAAGIEPHLRISDKFIADAGFSPTDGRYAGLISVVTPAPNKYYSRKYDRALMNVPIIRSAELVLDRAEINAMNALTNAQAHADAIADLNLIRDRSIPSYVPLNTATLPAALVLAEVKKERIRELAFEGDRLHNLRRMHQEIPAGSRVAPYNISLAWNSNRLLFKIPDAEIQSSTNIIQNPD